MDGRLLEPLSTGSVGASKEGKEQEGTLKGAPKATLTGALQGTLYGPLG